MRNQWRLLFLRSKSISDLQFKVQSSPTLPLSHHSTLNSRIPQPPAPQFHFQNPSFPRLFTSSSEQQIKASDQSVITPALIELYSDPIKSNEDVMLELKSKNGDLASSSDYVNELFSNRGSGAGDMMFFDSVMSKGSDDLSSNSCNRLLGMLGANGLVKQFWDLVEIMKKKGYGVKKGASVRAMAKFEELGLEADVQRLKDLFALGSVDGSVEKASSRVCKVVRQGPWGDEVETKLQEMGVVFSGDLVKSVLENLGTEPNKAVIFFRWVEESGLYKHDEKTYNAIARELAREDYMDKFWKLIDEMKTAGYELEKATYVRVLSQFVRKKMLKDAVDLYEFAMGGNVKPSVQDCPFLLRKIVTGNELDMDLFSKVLKIYKESGNTLTNSALDAVLKSLTSVGRFGECNKILRAMEEVGFLPGEKSQGKIAFQLSKDGKTEEASEFLDLMEASGTAPSYKAWGSLIEGYCLSGHLDKARDCFQEMIKKEVALYAGYPLEILISAYCSKERVAEAYKLLSEVVVGKGVEPWHTTYKLLISKLLDNGLFKEATNLLAPMKNHGYPPFVDPFVKNVAKTGTTDETLAFLKAMTVKKSPSTAVYMRVFKAHFKAGRHSQAQDLLSKCPRYIRNHATVFPVSSYRVRVVDLTYSGKNHLKKVQALMGIKASLLDPHGVLENWDGDAVDPCSWTMVTCSTESLVIGLGTPSQNLSGTLSPSIGNLTNLQIVLLQNNNITGPIPTEIGKLKNLQTLDLSNNHFINEIPSSLSHLNALQYMKLNNNSLCGSIPESVANMTQLALVDLSFNNLSGPVPRFPSKTFNIVGNPLMCPTGSEQQCYGMTLMPISMPLNTTKENTSSRRKSHKVAVAIGTSLGCVFFLVFGIVLIWFRRTHNREPFFDVKDKHHDEVSLGNLRKFQFRELQIATHNFSNKNILGKGGFGHVYKGTLHDGTSVAVKRLKDGGAAGGVRQFQTEVEMISLAVHRNLLRLYGFCMTPTEKLLVYPYMSNGSVASRLKVSRNLEKYDHESTLTLSRFEISTAKPVLDWGTRKKIALGAGRGLLYLHEQCDPKIIHRDVKAANILLDDCCEAVVGDFGLAKLLDHQDSHVTTAVRGTVGHIAPEYLSTGQSSEKTDVFGFGILLLELITGQRALEFGKAANQKGAMLDWVRKIHQEKKLDILVDKDLTNNYDRMELEELVKVALLCTQYLPGHRPKMSEVVRMLEGDGLAERWEASQGISESVGKFRTSELSSSERYSDLTDDSSK
ncbi:hypothetical protein OSB04_007324 [Centaurea solstitialis]|uniref:non-specific serine/threonine protein kinase n=1 Tax=Centaurea solstitialis TaxID=347529 RepID=A0AA38TLD5_9ASTR|nr:hypothetical protein OSB04_007324 [Centaurea solstitialis]